MLWSLNDIASGGEHRVYTFGGGQPAVPKSLRNVTNLAHSESRSPKRARAAESHRYAGAQQPSAGKSGDRGLAGGRALPGARETGRAPWSSG